MLPNGREGFKVTPIRNLKTEIHVPPVAIYLDKKIRRLRSPARSFEQGKTDPGSMRPSEEPIEEKAWPANETESRS